MTTATLHDGSTIELETRGGSGPVVLLAVNPTPVEGEQAEEMRKWGADPELGRPLVDGLAEDFRVVAFDYEGHVLAHPKPDTLTPDNVAADVLAVADAVGAERFAYYGYSWLALAGLQLALRTDRLSALVMGGYPPLGGPYAEMLRVTEATYEMTRAPETAVPGGSGEPGDWSSVEVTLSEGQARQFATLYRALRGFDDSQAVLSCPRLCFVGSADEIVYDERWGGTHVSIAGPVLRNRAAIEARGWDVEVLDGLDHAGAMRAANVLPFLRPWLDRVLFPPA
ncbi:MAG: alpha/beta fold hydrolase [Nonomuraea sp.]|nr:alpha/beta fold hydrolase [Nonomuraea sp.]NUP66052.1 alpha/beta fold hydrolase [Nonomuraea sp.]NUP77173.1 alpha/beta fold hydrolase [Nonomuraea sp.]NUS03248.1 alpha/beta fold hydrolase [Nonomuraea sp.]